MGKLIGLVEASERLGVSAQTLINWDKRGIISINRMNKNYFTVNEDDINALSSTTTDIGKALTDLEAEREELRKEKEALRDEIKKTRSDIMFAGRLRNHMAIEGFFLAIPDMLWTLGIIKQREAEVTKSLISGNGLDGTGEIFGLTRERVRQILEKVIRKSSDLTAVADKIQALTNEIEELKMKMADYPIIIAELQAKIKEDEARLKAEEARRETEKRLVNHTPIPWEKLSYRTQNCLMSLRSGGVNIETLEQLSQFTEASLSRARTFGRKAMSELTNVLRENGLSWGTKELVSIFSTFEERAKGAPWVKFEIR